MKSLRIIPLVLCVCLFSVLAGAQSYSWQFAGWHGGGCYPNLVFDSLVKGRVYLVSDIAGIFRSDDLGENWYFVTKGLGSLAVSQVVVAPSDSNILYAATKKGVYLSKDAGASWKATDNFKGTISFERPASYRSMVVDLKNSGRICVGTSKGALLCSNNFGSSWNEVELAPIILKKKAITAVLFDRQGRIYAASSSGLIRCQNEKGGCQKLDGPQNITDLVFSNKNPGTIFAAGEAQLWISKDDGVSWQASQAVSKGKIYRIAVDEKSDPAVIHAAWNENWKGGVVVSKDFGQSWEKFSTTVNGDVAANPSRVWADKNGKITGVFINPFDPRVLFRTDWWGVWRSDDGGASWNEKVVGAPNTVATDLALMPNGDLLVASMDNGLLRSADEGKNYQMLFPLKYDDAQSGHVWRVAVAGESIIATSSPWNKIVNQVIISSDGGKTFKMIQNGLPDTRPKQNTMWGEGYPRALAVDPKDSNIIYLGIDGDDGGGLFVSRDRGQNWQRSVGQPGSLRIYHALAVDPTDSKRIVWGACGKNGGVYVSSNGGESFDHVLKDMSWVFDVHVSSDGTIFAAGDSGGAKLYASSNHGKSWSLSGEFGQGRALASIAVDPSNPKRVAVATVSWSNEAPCKIFLSENGGKKWRDITGGLPDGAGASNMMFDPKSNSLYITRYAGSVYRLKFQ